MINSRDPLYKAIYEDLKHKIESHVYSDGQYLPAERQLSAEYQVERLTLRKALKLLQEDGYIQTMPGAGSRVIAPAGSQPPQDSSYMIAFVISGDMDRQAQLYHIEICNYLEEYCKADGANVLFAKVCATDEIPPYLRHPDIVRGVIWVANVDSRFLEYSRSHGIPSICLAHDYPEFPRINYADFESGFQATKHLLSQGCRNIAFLNGIDNSVNRNRLAGYREALASCGLSPESSLIADGNWSFSSGSRGTRAVLETGVEFDGLVASNDMMALGAMQELSRWGLKIPDQVKVIGIDNIDQSRRSNPALSTIAVNQKDIARTAYLFMKDLLKGRQIPEEVIIPGKLIVRESSVTRDPQNQHSLR